MSDPPQANAGQIRRSKKANGPTVIVLSICLPRHGCPDDWLYPTGHAHIATMPRRLRRRAIDMRRLERDFVLAPDQPTEVAGDGQP